MTFEAYRIAVKISLVNSVSAGLLAMSSQFSKAGVEATALQAKLNKIKLLGMTGMAIGGAGFMGLGMIGKMIKPATEYAHQLNVINMAGWTQKDIANAVGDAWKNTSNVITTTATGNLRSLLDLKNILGDLGEARMALPVVSRIQAVLGASSETRISGHAQDFAYSMAKALDIIGAARNPGTFNTEAEAMSKAIIATQGRVTPEAFKSVFQYARQAKFGLSDEFKYQILPSLMQENSTAGGSGGGSRGVGPMLAAFFRTTNQGYINKKSLPLLEQLGLVNGTGALTTTSTGTTVGHFKGSDLASANPFQWVQTVLMPAIYGKYGHDVSRQKIQNIITDAFRGNQLGASLALEFALKPINFLRDQKNIVGTMSTADAYKASLSNDPNTAFKALSAQWTNFKTAFTMGVVPVLIPALIHLTTMFNNMAEWARSHPGLAKGLAVGFASLFAALAVGGTLITTIAAFKFLALAMPAFASGVGVLASTVLSFMAPIAAIAGAGAVGYGIGSFLNKGVDWLTQKATGGAEQNLGGAIFDWTHPAKKQTTTHVHVTIDGEHVRHIITHNMPVQKTGWMSGVNPQHSPLSPGLNFAPGL